jgi:UDP-N-acetylmuramate--alanine ligase
MIKTLQQFNNIHCIGIGGSGLSALAAVLNQQGYIVTGSDSSNSTIIVSLRNKGISTINIGHNSSNVSAQTELVIYSHAISFDNAELQEAKKRNIPCLSYPEAVGLLSKESNTIAICGTHGKTTTTAMIASVFKGITDGINSLTVIVGAKIPELGQENYFYANNKQPDIKKYFVLEACEYKRSFLNYHPTAIVLTNIEIDHLDYYKNENDYLLAFEQFLGNLAPDGLVIANFDDKNVTKVCNSIKFRRNDLKIISYGFNADSTYNIKNSDLKLSLPGKHNLYNAFAALICAIETFHPDPQTLKLIKNILKNYKGAGRRFEEIGKIGNTVILDDYAHHPTEIKATLNAAREKYLNKKILCIFQPHQYSRTHKLLNEFAQSFSDADEVIIPDIYKARDSADDIKSVNAQLLVREIQKHKKLVSYGGNLETTFKNVKKRAANFGLIITMGAGDIGEKRYNLINPQD